MTAYSEAKEEEYICNDLKKDQAVLADIHYDPMHIRKISEYQCVSDNLMFIIIILSSQP